MILLLAAVLPMLSDQSFQLARYELVVTYFLVVLGLNFSFGYAAQMSIAQPVVMGTSAYVAALLNLDQHLNAWETLGPAVVCGIAMGIFLTLAGLRLQGWYLGVVAFFAVLVFPDVLLGTQTWTGGDNGIGPISVFPGLGTGLMQYELILACGAVAWLALRNLTNSTWGIKLRSMRESPRAAESVGVNLKLLGIGVVAIGSVPVSVGGWVLVHSTQIVTPDLFGFNLMLLVMGAVLLGGRGTLWGPLIGTGVFEGLNLYIGPFSAYNPIVLGLGVLVAATAFPLGITPIVRNFVRQRVLGISVVGSADRAGPSGGRDVPGLGLGSPAAPAASNGHLDLPGPGGGPGDSTSSPLVLTVAGIRKAFGGRLVLNDVELELRRGQICGLVGPNGSGKTTLLNIITGFIAADSGQITLDGQSILGWAPHRVARHGITRSFQVPQLITELSAAENIRFGLHRRQRVGAQKSLFHGRGYWRQREVESIDVRRAGSLVGLNDLVLQAPVKELSLGLRRIVEIARAVISAPSVICLDEPAAGLGGRDLDHLKEALRAVAASGTAILLVEHNLDFVREMAEQLIVLDHGEIVSRGPTATAGLLAFSRRGAGSGGQASPAPSREASDREGRP